MKIFKRLLIFFNIICYLTFGYFFLVVLINGGEPLGITINMFKYTAEDIGYTPKSLGVESGKNELAINDQYSIKEEHYTFNLIPNDIISQEINIGGEKVKFQTYNDFYFTLHTNISPLDYFPNELLEINYGNNMKVDGAFYLDLQFNSISSVIDSNDDNVNFLFENYVFKENCFYHKNFYINGAEYYSFIDFSKSSLKVELKKGENSKVIKAFSSGDLEQAVLNDSIIEIKDEYEGLIRETGIIYASVYFHELIVRRKEGRVDIIVNPIRRTHVIYANYEDYNQGLLIPTEGIKHEVFSQVAVIDEDDSVFVYSKETKIKIKDSLKLAITHSPYSFVKDFSMTIFYFDSITNLYKEVHYSDKLNRRTDFHSHVSYVEIDSSSMKNGIYRIEIKSLITTDKGDVNFYERYEYYFER